MKKIKENILKAFESKTFFGIVCGLGCALVLVVTFYCGTQVGYHRVSFERDWGENYGRNFGMMGPRRGFDFRDENFPNAHGAVGKIIKIALPSIIVQDRDNTEKVILLKDDTKIQEMTAGIKISDLKVDDFVVIIGSPNTSGQIEAKFIRVIPNPALLNNPQEN